MTQSGHVSCEQGQNSYVCRHSQTKTPSLSLSLDVLHLPLVPEQSPGGESACRGPAATAPPGRQGRSPVESTRSASSPIYDSECIILTSLQVLFKCEQRAHSPEGRKTHRRSGSSFIRRRQVWQGGQGHPQFHPVQHHRPRPPPPDCSRGSREPTAGCRHRHRRWRRRRRTGGGEAGSGSGSQRDRPRTSSRSGTAFEELMATNPRTIPPLERLRDRATSIRQSVCVLPTPPS